MLNQVFLARFEPVVKRFGPWKSQNALKMWQCWNQKWVKNGSKTHFPKTDRGPFGLHKQVKRAHVVLFEAFWPL